MKHIILFVVFLLCVFIGYGQTISLTFTAKDDNTLNIIGLNSVWVENISLGCDTMVFGASPTLVLLFAVGINDHIPKENESLRVMPNVPNPFIRSTHLSVYLAKRGYLQLSLSDITGKTLVKLNNDYEAGLHTFEVTSGGPGLLFLNASNSKDAKSVKLISTSNGTGGVHMEYVGMDKGILKSSSSLL